MSDPGIPASIVDIFHAMNSHDADRAAASVTPDVEIVIGPHVLSGVDAVRELAAQQDPELDIWTEPVDSRADGDDLLVNVRRISRWRSDGSSAGEETSAWRFSLADDARIARVVIGLPG